MKRTLLILVLVSGCAADAQMVPRSSACTQITAARLLVCPTLVCPYDDGTFQGTCFPTEEGCEWSCDAEAAAVCADAVQAAGTDCNALAAAVAAACHAEDCS